MQKLVSREEFLGVLETQWGSYLQRFQAKPALEQTVFLQSQGYPSLSALLAHVIAWWSEGIQEIGQFRSDPAKTPTDYDVDSFNAQAVAHYAPLSEADVLRLFEETRLRLLGLVKELSPQELDHPAINNRLVWEILNHYKEHELN
jgi:hypothetical protein